MGKDKGSHSTGEGELQSRRCQGLYHNSLKREEWKVCVYVCVCGRGGCRGMGGWN